jgi:Rod binding domain-containing protein
MTPVRPPTPTAPSAPAQLDGGNNPADNEELREAFNSFVGETFYRLMLKSMRSTVGEPAYVHGGQAEEIFESQLDETLAQKLTEATADKFTDPLFELFTMNRL